MGPRLAAGSPSALAARRRAARSGLKALDGGSDEFAGVFWGTPSCASSSATRAKAVSSAVSSAAIRAATAG